LTAKADHQRAFNRRTREAAAVRRARILDAAMELIGERGYYGFTIQELGTRCGLSKPGLLHYFPSKNHVLLAVLEELEARETIVMEPLAQMALEGHGENHGREKAISILIAMVDRTIANARFARVVVGLHGEALDPAHPAHDWWREREARTLGFLRRLLSPFLTDAEAASRLILASMDGLLLQWLSGTSRLDLAQAWRYALTRLVPELHR
jgi:AcrR family transcriptional regulator